MAGHLDPDVLADFREGLLGRRHSARIRAHLRTCPTCASLDQDLAQVTELLASAPAPRMPDHLVTRLENALAAEAARTANQDLASQGAGAADTAGRADRNQRRRSWQLRPATLGVAAAVAAVLAVGGYGLANLHSGISSGPSSAVGAPAHRPAMTMGPNARGVKSNGSLAPPPMAGQVQVIESGTDYLPGRLASQARAALAGQASKPARAGPLEAPGPTSQLQSCVKAVTGGRSPLVVDEALYQGRSATIIIAPPSAGQAGKVWVTGPACSATNSGIITETQLPAG